MTVKSRTQSEYALAAYDARELYELAVIQSHSVTPSLHRDDEMVRYLRNLALQMGFRVEELECSTI